MYLSINGANYPVSLDCKKQLLEDVNGYLTILYNNLPVEFRLIADQSARALIYDTEKKLIKKGVDKEEAKSLRPVKGESPTLALLRLLAVVGSDFLENAHVVIVKDDITQNITGFGLVME